MIISHNGLAKTHSVCLSVVKSKSNEVFFMPKHHTTGKQRESDGELPLCDNGHCTVSKAVTFHNDIMALTAFNFFYAILTNVTTAEIYLIQFKTSITGLCRT